MSGDKLTKVSIILCCHNSARRLEPTLRHIAAQQLHSDVQWEVLLVDNGSTDNTVEFSLELWSICGKPAPLRIVHETRPGIAYARRSGVLAAKYETLVFCDDDNWLCSTYVADALDTLSKDITIGIVGGGSHPVFEQGVEPPCWFWNKTTSYAVGAPLFASGDITERGYVWTAGMALRGTLLKKIYQAGIEHLLSGQIGEQRLSGEDSEICKWYMIKGYRLYYNEKLTFGHYITVNRLTEAYYMKLKRAFKLADPLLSGYYGYAMRSHYWGRISEYNLGSIFKLLRNEMRIMARGWRVKGNVALLRRIDR